MFMRLKGPIPAKSWVHKGMMTTRRARDGSDDDEYVRAVVVRNVRI